MTDPISGNGVPELAKAIECLLFASTEPLSSQRLIEVLEAEPGQVQEAVAHLGATLESHGLQLVELAGGYQLATRPEYAAFVYRLLQPAPARLSPQGLEVLAIVAYRQPITRPEIDAIRGVNSQHSVATLAEKGLVTVVGRKEAPGRPVLYGTTPHFLATFGLKDLGSLPSLEEFARTIEQPDTAALLGWGRPDEVPETPDDGDDQPLGDPDEDDDEPWPDDDDYPADDVEPPDAMGDHQPSATPVE